MRALLTVLLIAFTVTRGDADLPDTQPLNGQADLSTTMVGGMSRWLESETGRVAQERDTSWQGAAAGPQWEAFARDHRARLRQVLGMVDLRIPGGIEEIRDPAAPATLDTSHAWTSHRVRWPVFDGVYGEGVMLRPTRQPLAAVIAIPDADQVPEQLLWAQRLADAGCVVVIPVLVNRDDRWSGSEKLQRFTNQPHREWIYRQAFEMGRTLIGYEVEKILAAIDSLGSAAGELGFSHDAIGVAGYGEGGLLALYSAALEPRIQAALVSGYFQNREQIFEEPIYRNVFGLLREFSDAQLAALVAPRPLIIEDSVPPPVSGPPAAREGRKGAAPGKVWRMPAQMIASEIATTQKLVEPRGSAEAITLVASSDGEPVQQGSEEAIRKFSAALGIQKIALQAAGAGATPIAISPALVDARQQRTVRELERFTQSLVQDSERDRGAAVWSKIKPGPEWEASQRELRERLWSTVIGKIPADQLLALNPRSRVVREDPKWIAHEVVLDVLPDVFAWGWLLVPRDLKPGERRPVVVCQHGLEGVPEDVLNEDPKSQAFGYYKAFAARLAEQGFIVYAPHNPYRGGDRFRMLQRRANPLGLSLFSFIIAQHDAATRWLASLPFVDPERIAFYGLSYGGKSAMRIPAVLDRYCLSICSGDFNEWVRKNVLTDAPYSYMFTAEWEMPEWNLANVANYGEMAMLIAPRPFMVERGHDDRVAVDEWVAYEFAKVRRGYVKLGIGDRAQIEWFDGPHTIHGEGTFEFLHRHLRRPK